MNLSDLQFEYHYDSKNSNTMHGLSYIGLMHDGQAMECFSNHLRLNGMNQKDDFWHKVTTKRHGNFIAC